MKICTASAAASRAPLLQAVRNASKALCLFGWSLLFTALSEPVAYETRLLYQIASQTGRPFLRAALVPEVLLL